ncbi:MULTISPECIES: SURF1 family protein [Kocuria]|uniref:SURF1-like protein n=2 Tax=Kocuria TaxID=57493 RepID=A0A2N4T101_9MICC|nr:MULTISPECIES: SURF1 family protein [Kocuria]KLU08403.1 cytochrome oxidase biogenesis protein Surf1, facilitates heme A insertion [Kocuria sp. SM24M-10]PLC11900.1 cytochrome oxidase biogenesis protein Surf1, facilitates heme A insertion [Kocuria flava]WJZ68501.1 SURF1 family protein [Kocuria rosea]
MSDYRFLLSGKWLGFFALACAAAAVSVYLAGWQMDRNDHLVGENAKITRNYRAEPLTGNEAAAQFAAHDPTLTWHPVELTGEYLAEDQVLVRNRPQDGRVGYEVLVPFRTQAGDVVVLDRGWIPTGSAANGMPDEVPAPPTGQVSVTARLRPGEPAVDRGAPEGQIATIQLQELQERWDRPIGTAAYAEVFAEDPAPAVAPAPAPEPEIDSGPHLSYSLQWYAFAALFFVAYGYAARQQARNDAWDRQYAAEMERHLSQFYDEDGNYVGEGEEELVIRQMEMADDMPAHLKSLMRPKPQRRRHRPTWEEEEDALLDAFEDGVMDGTENRTMSPAAVRAMD